MMDDYVKSVYAVLHDENLPSEFRTFDFAYA